jgi:4-oxalocrotonate tautomerase
VITIPVVHVNMWKGISQDAVEKIIEGITQVFIDMGIPSQAVEVLIHEVPKKHWGIDGKPATEARPDSIPP